MSDAATIGAIHPGAIIALGRLAMNELGVARAIAAGDLTSPQQYENVWLFAIRITGTGQAFRNSINEHVWRDPSLYLNDDFLARCNGLPVIWVHPEKKPLLTSDEFADRVIGTIFLPYIQGQDVWGIAKIYDAPAIEAMQTKQFSTSPGVNFADPTVNTKLETEDGRKLLIEGDPSLLDHIAVVTLGVWDKSGPPTGVLNHSLTERVDSMADETEAEKKAKEDAARRDAGGNIDRILTHLDSMSKRMDAMEMADKARRDADEERTRKDSAARRDAEREPWMKADAAACERDDAEEKAEREEMVAKGEPEETAADKARKSRKDRMDARRDASEGEAERAAKADKARRDAEEKVRADAEREDAKARTDAVLANQTDLARKIAEMPMPTTAPEYTAMADSQATYEPVYQMLGKQAPGPLQGETPIRYRGRLARGLQTHSPQWKSADLRTLSDDVLGIAEQTIRADAAVAARSADDVPEGALLPVTRVNESGHRITEFRGRDTIFKRMAQPQVRATKWHTERRA